MGSPRLTRSAPILDSLSDDESTSSQPDSKCSAPEQRRFVYDGDGSNKGKAAPGSEQIEDIFTRLREPEQGNRHNPYGRSDYGPFITVGIPAGGLFSGAEGEKTAEQAAIYGGTAGEPYDPCYHQACDTTNNLNTKALFELGDAAAHATMTLARSRTGFFEDGSFRTRARAGIAAKRLTYSGPQAA